MVLWNITEEVCIVSADLGILQDPSWLTTIHTEGSSHCTTEITQHLIIMYMQAYIYNNSMLTKI